MRVEPSRLKLLFWVPYQSDEALYHEMLHTEVSGLTRLWQLLAGREPRGGASLIAGATTITNILDPQSYCSCSIILPQIDVKTMLVRIRGSCIQLFLSNLLAVLEKGSHSRRAFCARLAPSATMYHLKLAAHMSYCQC